MLAPVPRFIASGAPIIHEYSVSPWGNGCRESFNDKVRDEPLNGEIFYGIRDVHVIIDQWRINYNTKRSHSTPEYRPPAPRGFCSYRPIIEPSNAMQ